MRRPYSICLKALIPILCVAAGAAAAAGNVDLALKNAAIEKLEARIAERAPKLIAWKDKGAVGEAASGLLHDCQLAGLELLQKKEVRDLIAAENEDRHALFRELRIANNIPAEELGRVAAAYAAQRRAAAAPSHKVQNPANGKWVAKKDL